MFILIIYLKACHHQIPLNMLCSPPYFSSLMLAMVWKVIHTLEDTQ